MTWQSWPQALHKWNTLIHKTILPIHYLNYEFKINSTYFIRVGLWTLDNGPDCIQMCSAQTTEFLTIAEISAEYLL